LTGRALAFGAPRGMTAPGWAPFARSSKELSEARSRIRAELGIPNDALVIGIVGSLAWTRRVGYCYGYELVRAISQVKRSDARVLIVGDGDGKPRLEKLAEDQLGRTVVLTGRVTRNQVPNYLAAMDVGSLPQSLDTVGSYRYTTKLSEYLAAGLPVVTGQIPLAYDLDGGWLWRLPGVAPWHDRYIQALAEWINRLTPTDLAAKRSAVPADLLELQRDRQVARVTAFVKELLAERGAHEYRR
jgi:glycosyltransferase involved in cell wall biosynthesis